MFPAHRLMMVYICTKFHENILNGIRVMERTRKVNGRTDRQTDGGHDIIRPVFDGRIKKRKIENAQVFRKKKKMYKFHLKIRKINEKFNTIVISPETLTSYFDVALNKPNAGQGSVFYDWTFSAIQYLCPSENGF